MKSFLVDVNVWLALAYDRHIHYRPAHAWFANVAPESALFCRFTQVGFLRLLTNSKVMGADVMGQTAAWRVYDALCRDLRVSFVGEPAGVEPAFRRLTQNRHAVPGNWTDAYLAALAVTHGLTVVSFDRGFMKMEKVEAMILNQFPTK